MAALIVAALLGALVVMAGTVPIAPSAFAIPGQGIPFDCSGGTIYQVQRTNGSNGILNAVAVGSMSGTTPVTASQVSATIPNSQPNALGISPGGTAAWVIAPQNPTVGGPGNNTLTFQLYSYDTTTQVWTPHTAVVDTTGKLPAGVTATTIANGGIVAGAIDPLSGNYYWAALANAPVNAVTFFGWNTATNTSIGVVANSTWPEANPGVTAGTNGDIAFDRNGNVLIVSSVNTNAALGRIPGPLPTTPQTTPPTLVDTTLATYPNPAANAYNGIAFDNTGSLFLEFSTSSNTTSILKVNPNTGAAIAGPSQVNGGAGTIGVDLSACSVPPVMQLQKNVINRQADTDQFNLSITGGGISGGNTATTSGTAIGIQPAKAGPVVGVTGTTYTFTETGAGTTVLANYTTTYQCVDQGAGNAVVASGNTTSFNLTLPPPGPTETGQSIVCTFTNSAPRLVVTKAAAPVSTTPVVEGQVVNYTLTFDNSGGGQPAAVNYTDNLTKVLDDATVTTQPALATGAGLTVSAISGGAFTVTGTLAARATATVTFAVTVNTPDTGDHQLDNFVVPTGTPPPATCLPTNPACTTNPVPALVVTKTASPASTTPVVEGQVVTYTLTFSNAAGKAPATVNHTDDLSRVTDDATVTTPPALTSGSGLVVGPITSGTFTITGAVPAGTTATVTFAVTVNTPDTGDHQLDNFLVPTGTPPPATCLPSDPACTTHPVPALVVTKTASPVSTTPVVEGQVVTYTLTFSNVAGKAPATVNHTDDLSRVIDDATVTTPPALASGSGLVVGPIAGGTFTITGTLAAGATATVTFAVTVNTPDAGDHQLDNFVVATGTTPPATCLPSNPTCTTNPVPALVVTKTASPASTTPVVEGQVVTYTLTFSNSAGKAPAPVNHTDDLSGVIDDATVTTPPALATGTGLTVSSISGGTFTVTGAVPAGTTATVTFAVTVNTPDTGDHQLDNFVVPTGTTPPSQCVPTDPTCTTNPVPALVVTKSADPVSTTPVNEGQVVTYTLTFSNAAGKAPATVNHTDDLTRVLDDATVTSSPILASGSGLVIGPIVSGTFTITGAVPAGTTATVTFAVTVNTPDTGDHQLDNFVVPTGTTPPTQCVATDPTCTTHPVPGLVVTKTGDPVSTTPVVEGQVVTYTLTFSNAAGKAPATVNHTDDLSGVLDDATVTAPPILASGTGLVIGPITSGTFTITGTIAAGATATVTFSVTVNTPDTGDHQLDNFVVPTGTTPPSECLPTDPRCTTNPVPALVVTKTASPASTTPVVEGQVVTYTLTFSNAAGKAPAPVDHLDDLSGVLDDATVTTPPILASGTGLVIGPIAGGTFTITGTIAAGATATVTFAVTVNTPDTGDHQLDNFVVPTGTTPPTECVPTDPTCTTNPVPALVVTKIADPASTTPVNEGDIVSYTLTFSNTAGRAPATVNHTDDLSGVLDDATVTTPPILASGTGLVIGPIAGGTFTITGTIAAGATATVTFAVTVNTPDTGDHQLDNFVVPTGTTPPSECLPTDPRCTTNPVPALVVTKTASPASTTPVVEGQVVSYTLTFDNSAGKAPATVDHLDDLSGVLDDATVTTPPALATGSGLTVSAISGGTFTITGAVPAGTTATVTFAVTVNTPDTGDHQLDNFVVPTGTTPPTECVPTDPTCTTNPVPALVVTKTGDPVSTTTVHEGDVITYTLTFANTAGKAPAPVDHTDHMVDVLDDATLTAPPTLTSGTGLTIGAITAEQTFTVTGLVAAGETATVTFSVTVNTPDQGNHQLDNFVVPTGTTPPTSCLPTDPTCTTNPVAALVVTKTSVPPSTTPVNEGDVITYTLTFDNSVGKAPFAPVDYTDDLSRVLDDATVTTQPVSSNPDLTVDPVPITGTSFTITGEVPDGEIVTVTFAVTVNRPDTGDHRLDNFVVPTGTTPPDECVPGEETLTLFALAFSPNQEEPEPAVPPTCTTHPVAGLLVSKSVVPASTTPVSEGEVLTYTLTFSSIGQAPVAVDYVDDLTRVLDDATVTTPPALASGSGLTLGPIVGGTFAISGVVDAGATATITFSVTVNTPDTGDRSLDNFLVPTGTTPPAQCLSADPTCTTNPVLEASLGVGAGDVSRTEPLARTGAGAALGRMLEVGALLVLAGAAMVTFGRRRGRRPSSPAAR